MVAILRVKSEEIDTKEKRRKYTVCVIGCKEKGITYAISFAKAGFRVLCTDPDLTLVRQLSRGKTNFLGREIEFKLKILLRRGVLNVTSELQEAVSQSNIVVMTITSRIDSRKQPDYSEIENICKQVGRSLNRGVLFIYGGIAGLGFTEGVIKETLEDTSGLRVGEDLGLVYAPIHPLGWDPSVSGENQEFKVAAFDENSLETAATVLEEITGKTIKRISDVKSAEAALLFSIVKQDTNLALANELAIFCENAGVDYFEILKLVSAHCSLFSPKVETDQIDNNETYVLIESAENLNVKLRIPALARKINEDIVRHAINLTKDALRSCGKTIRRAKVAVFGNAKPKTATAMFVKMLERRGAKANLYDPMFSKSEIHVSRVLKRSMKETVEGTDCIVLLTPHNQFKRLNLKRLITVMKKPASIVDLTGIFEPEKVERKGFKYRGLGRRAENK